MFVPVGPGVEYLAGYGKDWRVTAMQGVDYSAWRGRARLGLVRQCRAWIIRRGDAMRGSVGQGTVWPCVDSLARSGVLRFVAVLHGDDYGAWRGMVMQGTVGQGVDYWAVYCSVGSGSVRLGAARFGKAWTLRCVPVMWCFVGYGGSMLGVDYDAGLCMAWRG